MRASITRRTRWQAAAVAAVAMLSSRAVAAQAGQLYYPVTPCRVADTRLSGGPLAANSQRTFVIRSVGPTGNYAAQGGSTTGCGVPADAQAVFFNFTVVQSAGAGTLRAFPTGQPAPLSTVLSYASIPGQSTQSGGILLPVCTGPRCTGGELTVQADLAATGLVIDVVGYTK